MDVISFLVVVWALKVLAEDTWATTKGQTNPRIERRKARQRSRASNPIWNQFVGWLGDLAEDAREEQARKRKEKRERRERERRNADAIDAEVVDPAEDIHDAEVIEEEDERKHEDLSADECTYDWCAVHGKVQPECPATAETCTWDNCETHLGGQKRPASDQPTDQQQNNSEGDITMSETYGLDQSIAYCEALKNSLENHSSAGGSGEQYLGMLQQGNVQGAALHSAFAMQEAIASAIGAVHDHQTHLEQMKMIQEAYESNQDAGDKDYLTGGR